MNVIDAVAAVPARESADEGDAVVLRPMATGRPDELISRSDAMRGVLADVQQVAPTSATVLVRGETGVGKEVVARAIHAASPRRSGPMICVNCAAIPTGLIESELFGHERGAFTGALARYIGRFELADGSTMFLDEIGDMPLDVQVKLLRALDEHTIQRLGGGRSIKVDVRIIAATNRNLEEAVRDDRFREDLFYRLNVFPIRVPPLRERTGDIAALAWRLVAELEPRIGRRFESISMRSLLELERYSWPGNVRELRNVLERAMIVTTGSTLSPSVPSTSAAGAVEPGGNARGAPLAWRPRARTL